MASRRDILRMAGTLPFLSPALAAVLDGKRHISGYNPVQTPPPDVLWKWLEQLHNFGPIRMTGTPQCRAFEEFLAAEFTKIGFKLERDQFRLTSWECRVTDCSISVKEDSGPSPHPRGGGLLSVWRQHERQAGCNRPCPLHPRYRRGSRKEAGRLD